MTDLQKDKLKLCSMKGSLSLRKRWDTNVSEINNFIKLINDTIDQLSFCTDEERSAIIEEINNSYLLFFPKEVHPHHTKEYRKEHYVRKPRDEQKRLDTLQKYRDMRSEIAQQTKSVKKEIQRLSKKLNQLQENGSDYSYYDTQLKKKVDEYFVIKEDIRNKYD